MAAEQYGWTFIHKPGSMGCPGANQRLAMSFDVTVILPIVLNQPRLGSNGFVLVVSDVCCNSS